MSEMIERVARALARHDLCKVLAAGNEEARGYSTEAMANAALVAEKRLINAYVDQARAAIEAMREPTDAMIEAGAEVDEWCQSEGQSPQPDVYRKMIDEALK